MFTLARSSNFRDDVSLNNLNCGTGIENFVLSSSGSRVYPADFFNSLYSIIGSSLSELNYASYNILLKLFLNFFVKK